MQPTAYEQVNELIDRLLIKLRQMLGDKLVGLYLYGSLVTGDFDLQTSDVDLFAAIKADLSEAEFAALEQMHHALIGEFPQWVDRFELVYLSLHGLQTFRTERSPIAVISPGEPFNLKDAGADWLVNWYMVREKGIRLYGAPPSEIIPPISHEEFIGCIKDHLQSWQQWVEEWVDTRPSQAYAILTMCRGLYTIRNGEQVSKLKAARWAQEQLPEWSDLIEQALLWRKSWRDQEVDHAATLAETRRFVHQVIDLALG